MSREKHLKRLIGCWKPETHEQELRLVAVRSDSGGEKIDHLEVSGTTGKVYFLLNDNGKPRVLLIRCGQPDLHIDGSKCSKDVIVWTNDTYEVVEIWYSNSRANIQIRTDTSDSSVDLLQSPVPNIPVPPPPPPPPYVYLPEDRPPLWDTSDSSVDILLSPVPNIPVPPPPSPPPYVSPPENRPPLWALWASLPVTPRTPSSIESLDSSVYPIDSEGRIHRLHLDDEILQKWRIDLLLRPTEIVKFSLGDH